MLDAVCIGESMIVGSVPPPHRLRDAHSVSLHCAGAESNVAIGLAALGGDVAWAGRLGGDPFAGHIIDVLRQSGVDTRCVEYDSSAPTGVYFKDPTGEGTQVYYYRAGSAASRMGPGFLDKVPAARALHLSGITPALSDTCAQMVKTAVDGRRLGTGSILSFDVNYRPALWSVAEAAPVLGELAESADLVFTGLDEAQTLWNTATPDDVRELLPRPTALVVKDGAVGATLYLRDQPPVHLPTPPVDVVEAVGAGDAFAAGVLHGLLREAAPPVWLELGHYMASLALTSVGDTAPAPDPHRVEAIMAGRTRPTSSDT
ncbi:sugar kinase [Salininema proteolyticum]|uniref:Sugar kinase n=1 Tax=Salininema proteolyticum TaxID=1607685 RepID=A0ABV8TU08_9ACTN